MRTFSYIVAVLALGAGIVCLGVVPRFNAIYEEMGAELPSLTRVLLGSSGLLPGGIFILLAVLILVFAVFGRYRLSAFASGITLLIMLAGAAIGPVFLMKPLSKIIQEIDAPTETQKAEQDAAQNPGDL
jgi:type II secretory pathway component PulF